ncbi:hypothetical protein AUEXF2481DRAFT_39277 [Aureobasidium subglaciale EXF-2481]|uniref:Uncharacterized protein n=1 Tax=Aureobasidium subglaciale (strain EXF-2481) TaxID=1043005 RepID=A0A074YEN7_AURSE|nr:uncharacterized protein AUEXF2481DRAFT_39277 [Aureobasidium subglaciale EXF-2481]KAI5202673.1 hypothetical protein E4T38_05502 [Aureobasidium subglaciale]KAI5221537.1 hypothetical protein E4T40_05363 [Aureobasidium subglaciale]KAI5225520.1 hypothetical protein E4T41_05254 [Aureobasidium subglaciale]KAI5261511.1 hypothetical protein E4T46_05074 [Aureobasidium subglaciale]KEQ96190.1 hypothetical protein AUEXF2481DRAFT_39277 [Aureobasidium subglaciale EXF-2481]
MSQDLLAEFGDFTLKDNSSQNNFPHQIQSNHNSSLATVQGLNIQANNQNDNPWDEEDDDFGDFEEPEPTPQPIPQRKPEPPAVPKPVVQSAKEIKPTPKPTPQPAKKTSGPPVILKKAAKASQLPSNHPFAGHADILFDADEYDEFEDADVVGSWGDEDDFGDFETSATPTVGSGGNQKPTAPPAQPKTTKPSAATVPSAAVDLLGLDDPPETTSRASKPSGPLSAPKKAVSASKTSSTHPAAAPRQESTLSNDDAWDDFESPEPAGLPSSSRQTNTADQAPQIKLPTNILGDLTILPSTTGVAPSNIPPPSLLLTIFPPVLTSLAQQFLHPLSTLSPSQKSTFLSSPTTKAFLGSYVILTHILGHIIAGRKSRWKRDKHLAQSMRIGPAAARGGMKLTGVDKSETSREDTEVEVVLSVYREQVGRLKSAITGASVHGSKLTVPELGSVLAVRVAKADEGAITSTQACALCGLKREERVMKVDVAVEDSFGEFWVDGTNMHRACLRFWELFKGRLMSR